MNNERQVCHCGHDVVTHHEDGGPCLGMGCNVPSDDWSSTEVTDRCPHFRDDRKPDTLGKPKPFHPARYRGGVLTPCGCFECRRPA